MVNPDLIPEGSTQPQVVGLAHLTAPFPTTRASKTKAYVCTVMHAQLHRKDGKKLPFVYGFLETDILYDQQYLEEEIDNGNPYIRRATQEEIFNAHLRRDPHGTMKTQVRGEIEGELSAKYEAEIAALRDALSQSGIDPATVVGKAEASGMDDATKLSGAEAIRQKLTAANTVKAQGATVIMEAAVSPLKGIQSSADIGDAAGASNQK